MKHKILLADDSPTIQRLVKQTFADANFEIIAVSNGEAAIKKFEEIRPNVVLADIYMPGKNGYEVCEYVKQHSTLGGTPVVLLVGAFDAFDETKAKSAGASSNITKPFEPSLLVDLVNSVIANSSGPKDVEVSAPLSAPVIEPVIELEEETPVINPPEVIKFVPETSLAPELATLDALSLHIPDYAGADYAAPVEDSDILGLQSLFAEKMLDAPVGRQSAISDEEIDLIADRVIQRLTTQVVENIAWEVVPDITEKIVREELKRGGAK